MSDNSPASILQSPFDAIKHTDEQGEWWSARELAKLLGYAKWDKFEENVIQKAMQACESSGYSGSQHFLRTGKMLATGNNAHREIKDYRLTRYACYLLAMNSDPGKEIVAQAQTYFAVKTREAELEDNRRTAIEEMIAQAKIRVETRTKLSESYDNLESEAHQQGMRGSRNFAKLHNNGDSGMYTMSKEDLAKRHHLVPQHGQKKVNVNDHEGATEMAATILRNAIAGADIHQMDHPENPEMFQANYEAGKEIREVLLGHGIVPEDLPKEPHISEAQRIADGQIPLDMLPKSSEEQ